MFYHARLSYGDGYHYWWNYSRDEIIVALVEPFINGQVIAAHLDGHTSLLNMKNVRLLRVYKTADKLLPEGQYSPPSEFGQNFFEMYDCTQEIIDSYRELRSTTTSISLLQKAFLPLKKQVFIIMKFGDRFLDSAYSGVIKPLIEEFGYTALRVDEIQDSGQINEQVLESIATSKYILSDLSDARPNCYYETGFAHALGKELILTIRKGDIIHFDLSNHRFIIWETEADLRKMLRQRFESIMNSSSA